MRGVTSLDVRELVCYVVTGVSSLLKKDTRSPSRI